jgi:hypothetical protein
MYDLGFQRAALRPLPPCDLTAGQGNPRFPPIIEFGIGGCEFPFAIGILPECLSGENCRDDKYCRRFQ